MSETRFKVRVGEDSWSGSYGAWLTDRGHYDMPLAWDQPTRRAALRMARRTIARLFADVERQVHHLETKDRKS